MKACAKNLGYNAGKICEQGAYVVMPVERRWLLRHGKNRGHERQFYSSLDHAEALDEARAQPRKVSVPVDPMNLTYVDQSHAAQQKGEVESTDYEVALCIFAFRLT